MLTILGLILLLLDLGFCQKYQPTWESIDSRPLPAWYDRAKFGIFCHFGVYSVPAFKSEWFWHHWKASQPDKDVLEYVKKNYPPGFSYADFARDFKTEDFSAANFVNVVKSSRARYFVITSKHHEGFTMWPSAQAWNWNSVDVGPHRDLMGELKEEFSKTDIHFGLYFSQMDWFHPYFLQSNTSLFPDRVSFPQMLDIVIRYHPDVVWSDGDWDRSDEYWRSKEFLTWLYNESPVKDNVVVNDRWGNGTVGHHGGFLTYSDHYDPGHLLARKWENCLTLDKESWGHRRAMKASDVRTTKDLIVQLVRTISCGGNMLLNFGPDRFGNINPIFQERLEQLGQWVETNEEAIFDSKPWIHQNDSEAIWYTSKLRQQTRNNRIYNFQDQAVTVVYAFVLELPEDNTVRLSSVKYTNEIQVRILGSEQQLKVKEEGEGITVDIGTKRFPSDAAIVLKIEYAATVRGVNPLKELAKMGILDHFGNPIEKNNSKMVNMYSFH